MTFPINDQSAVRAMGFISTNFDDFGNNNFYYFDLSYIRQNDWITEGNISTYWGADLSFRLDSGGNTAPGVLTGAS